MFESNSIVVVTLRQRRAVQTITTCVRLLPQLAASSDASPHGWAQNWAHPFSDTANHSRISTFGGRPSLPWAQGVAGSNPVAPTTFRVPGFHRGSTYSALLSVTVHAFQPTTEGRLQNEQGRSARSPP